MQRVANCIYMKNGEILLLQKPRRGWWAIPGGKVEPKETVKAAAIREYGEETGIQIHDPIIKGIYTFLIEDDDKFSEWMMFTFLRIKVTAYKKSNKGRKAAMASGRSIR